jgi:hypothetical protein
MDLRPIEKYDKIAASAGGLLSSFANLVAGLEGHQSAG